MKLSRIEISNVLGLHRADIDVTSPILMVMGSNEAGKSSLRDAISMALIGDPVRVKLKKNYGQLLHEDAKKGRVTLLSDGELLAEYKLPSGDHKCEPIPKSEFVNYVINPALFARTPEADRRSMLFKLTACKVSPDVTAQMLIARGADSAFVDEVKPMLRSGFQSASKDAAERATQAKGAWRQLTGANWGSSVGETWEAEVPDVEIPTSEELDKIMASHKKAQSELTKGTEWVGEQTAKLAATKSYNARRNALRETAELLDRRKAKLAVTETDHAAWVAKLKPLEARLEELKTASSPVKCPCCEAELRIVAGALEKFTGLKENTKEKTDVALEVTKARKAVEDLSRVKVNDMRDVADSEAATKQLKLVEAEEIDMVDEAKLEEAKEKVNALRQREAQLRAEFNAKQQLRVDAAGVEDLTQRARLIHATVKAWLLIAEALSPAGIPSEILGKALKPVNDSLAILAGMCGWKKVEINSDMEITADGRLYGLMSESAQWRIDTLIALAIAQISELRFAVLDRFDVLDGASKKQLFKMLIQLGSMNLIDQVIVCGTYAEPIKGMPPSVQQVWVANGQAEVVGA